MRLSLATQAEQEPSKQQTPPQVLLQGQPGVRPHKCQQRGKQVSATSRRAGCQPQEYVAEFCRGLPAASGDASLTIDYSKALSKNLTQLKTLKARVVKLHDDGLECASTLLSMDKDLYQKISQDIEKKMSTLKVFTDTKLRPELVRFNLWETKKFALDVEKEIKATSELITECKQHEAILTTFLKHWRGVAGM